MGWAEWFMVAVLVLWPLAFLGICALTQRLDTGVWPE
jgi:hypothetical protein